MNVSELQFDPCSILGDPLAEPRSPGLHLSTIIRDIQQTIDPDCYADFTEAELAVYRAGGFLWERVYSQAMADSIRNGNIFRPPEQSCDGIACSPDNIQLEPFRVIETKCTWRSSRKLDNLEKYFWPWLWQTAAYCHLVGTTECELIIFFMMGNYAGSGPQCKSLLLSWTERELRQRWQRIVQHARSRHWI